MKDKKEYSIESALISGALLGTGIASILIAILLIVSYSAWVEPASKGITEGMPWLLAGIAWLVAGIFTLKGLKKREGVEEKKKVSRQMVYGGLSVGFLIFGVVKIITILIVSPIVYMNLGIGLGALILGLAFFVFSMKIRKHE